MGLDPFLVWRDTRTRQKNRNKTSRWCSYAGSGMSKIDQRCGINDTLSGVHLWNKECSAYCSHAWQNTHTAENTNSSQTLKDNTRERHSWHVAPTAERSCLHKGNATHKIVVLR